MPEDAIQELVEEGLDLKEAKELFELGFVEEEVYILLKCNADPEYANGLGEN